MNLIIVTGGSGFIGNAVVQALSKHGYDVVALHWPVNKDNGVTKVINRVVDLTREDAWDQIAEFSPIAIVHTAAVVPPAFDLISTQTAAAINQAIDNNVFNFCRQSGAMLIYASSTSVARIDGDYSGNAYALQKYHTEELLRSSTAFTGCSLRINSPYGPGQTIRTVIKLFIESAMAGKNLYYFGSGLRTQDFIHVEDVASAFVAALAIRIPGIFNLASGSPISMKDLAHLIVSLIPRCTSQVLPAEQDDADEDYRASIEIEETRKSLHWSPSISLEEGIRGYIRHLREAK